MILRPVRPASPTGPPITNLPVGLTRNSLAQLGLVEAPGDLGVEHRQDDALPQLRLDLALRVDALVVLGGDQELFDGDRAAVGVADGDLGLAVGAEVAERAVLAHRRQPFGEAGGRGGSASASAPRSRRWRSRTSFPGRRRRRRRARRRRRGRLWSRRPGRRPGRCRATACRSRRAPRCGRSRSRSRRGRSRSRAPSRGRCSGMLRWTSVEISPETTAMPVLTSVSQATRPPGSSPMIASRTPSEIWSATLSGWPSVTDSDVKRYSPSASGLVGMAGSLDECSSWRVSRRRGGRARVGTKSITSGTPSSP